MIETESIDFDKGMLLYKLVHNNISITSEHLRRNQACENLKKNPVTLKLVGRFGFPDPLWSNFDEFQLWLADTFRHLDDAEYVLIAWRAGGFWWKKKHVFAKRWIPFARFEVDGNTVMMTEEHKKNSRHRTYRVWLLYDQNSPESFDLLRPRRIRIDDVSSRRVRM